MFWRRKRQDADFAAEIQAHLELEKRRLMEEGIAEREAFTRAKKNFGNVTAAAERFHESRRWGDGFTKDLLYAFRKLKKSPAFTVTGIILLAIGVAANVAVFRLIGALFLRPIPVERPEKLVNIASIDKAGHASGLPSTVLDPLRDERTFRGVCGFDTPRLSTEINGILSSTGTLAMTGDCFRTLGLHAQLGRTFDLSEDSDRIERVVLLTDSLWRSGFGGRSDVIGQTIKVQGSLFTIVGVADRRFSGLLLGFPPGLIIPLHQTPLDVMPDVKHVRYFWVSIFARRAPGISEQQASARIQVLRQRLLEQSVPTRYNQAQRKDFFARRLVVLPATTGVDWALRQRYGRPLYIVFGICGCVLLVACINLAGLLLARGVGRQQEIAIRLSLGASRIRVARLFAFESVLLVFAGSVIGLLLSEWAIRAVLAAASKIYFDFHLNTTFDSYIALFACALILVVTLVMAAFPIWQAGRFDGAATLKKGGHGVIGARAIGQKALLAVQIALTLALVVSSGLFTSSIEHIYQENLGVDTRGLSESALDSLAGGYGKQPLKPYYRELLTRVESLPGVQSATLANLAPFWSMSLREPVSLIEGNQDQSEILAEPVLATDQFVRTLGLQMIAGESFHAENQDSTEPVAIVSEPLAKRLGGERVIGRHVRLGTGQPFQTLKVIGIVSNAQFSLVHPDETDLPAVYIDYWQHPQGWPWLLVKTANGTTIQPKALQDVVRSLGREYVSGFRTAAEAKDEALIENRLLAYLSAAFAVLGLGLAAIGLFGLLSYQAISRISEMGVRMALGAERAQIRRLIFGQILSVVSVGTVGGVALVLLSGPVIQSLAYGIGVYDWRLLSAAMLLLFLVSIVAAWIPAQRAASIEPLAALRQQ